ncbi:MAG TPA: 4a-hydroxytetrahydrobiopterin dehydratase [Patescibacteria group bacterium]|nr:4a-hydroxytetrahydrobiopterin dehydratase [Patescibacteria group bacterium]
MTAEWLNQNNSLIKEFIFQNFKEALAFVNKVGEVAESKNHHPDILMYGYKKVKITLTTHDQGKVTDKDTEMAELIDKIM